MKIKKPTKPIIREPLEEVKEFVDEAKKQIKAKAPSPEELLGGGPTIGQRQVRQIQTGEDEELRKLRLEKAKMLGEWRQRYQQIQREELAVDQQKKLTEEEQKKQEEMAKKKKQEEKKTASGQEAIAATGASQKRPTGLWGIGGRFKKMFKWFTPERKGRPPQ